MRRSVTTDYWVRSRRGNTHTRGVTDGPYRTLAEARRVYLETYWRPWLPTEYVIVKHTYEILKSPKPARTDYDRFRKPKESDDAS